MRAPMLHGFLGTRCACLYPGRAPDPGAGGRRETPAAADLGLGLKPVSEPRGRSRAAGFPAPDSDSSLFQRPSLTERATSPDWRCQARLGGRVLRKALPAHSKSAKIQAPRCRPHGPASAFQLSP